MKHEVILFQPYLRHFVLNFDRFMQHSTFVNIAKPPKSPMGYQRLPAFEKEIRRSKGNWKTRLRRLLGVPNVRIRFDRRGDVFFTYGSLMITPKPYCVYVESGLALYNYDPGIAKNPLARLIVMFLATRNNCKKLVFMSEAGRKSFFATIHYPDRVRRILEAKSTVIYPLPIEQKESVPRKRTKTLKLLFVGAFYIKGGLEVAHAYERIRREHPNVRLTVVTPLHMIRNSDLRYLQKLRGLTLHDAKLREKEMIKIYQTHDVFVLPTYREGFGMVVVEALAYGMPVIITDQYALAEMAVNGVNGYVFPNHPLKDYDAKTYKMFGRYHNPREFYTALFRFQKAGLLKPVEEFIADSVDQLLKNQGLYEKFSKNSLAMYKNKFHFLKVARQMDRVFQRAIER